MFVEIEKNGTPYYCTSEVQLESFLEDGWKKVVKKAKEPVSNDDEPKKRGRKSNKEA